ncbi:MAG: hypothetical protein ACI9YE_000157 [Psychroserpens sp.]|jgi:hypothetical protein
MKNIGGFFELEIAEGSSLYHDDAIKLSTGRACLNLILDIKKYSKVYVPYYCCDALFEPMKLKGITYEFYGINKQLEIIDEINLKPNEAIIYCNFFGIKKQYVDKLIEMYGAQLIIDDTHSFFTQGYSTSASFTTARKYFGVPDGAFLYFPQSSFFFKSKRNTDVSINHNLNRLIGLHKIAYQQYTNYEESLDSSINEISIVSEKILKTVDYESVIKKRNENFEFYKKELKSYNQLNIDDSASNCFCYPLLLNSPIEKKIFYKENIFIPSYWLDINKRKYEEKYMFESKLSSELLPLPIDHRYGEEDLRRVISFIKAHKRNTN